MKILKTSAWVGAIFVLGAAASVRWMPRYVGDNPEHAARLLCSAFESRRNIEMKWQGASFSPYKADDGNTDGGHNALPLLRAQEIISKHKNTSSPEWLRLQGELALLLDEPQAAVKLLGNLHETSPKEVPLLIDLATAYFEKAQSGDSDISYGRSLELLGEALDQQPENAAALYNSAIVEEKLFLFRQSKKHWDAYLNVDRTSGWSTDARQRLERTGQMVGEHEAKIKAPLHTPAEIAAHGLQDQTLLNEVEERIEEYSDVAVQDWLPQAYVSTSPSELKIALHELGSELLQKHGDSWLLDFIQAHNTTQMQEAVHALQESIRANVAGDAVDGKRLAENAAALFKVAGSEPGTLRAKVEEVNALRLLFKSPECNTLSQQLERPLTSHRYYQLLARVELEQTSCQVRAGNQDKGLESLKRAEIAVKDGKFSSQKINVINYQSALEALKDGRSGPLWQMSRNALRLFWSGLFPDKRAYPFYTGLADWAEQNDSTFLFYEFAGEAAATIDFTDLTSFRAMAHYRFAEAAVAAGRNQAAKDEFNHSEKLFQELPQNESVLIHRTGIEVLLARLEAQRGDHERALARLAKIEPGISGIASFLTQYQFYSTRAFLFDKKGNYPDAERDYRRAISAAEGSLRAVKDERERLAWSRSYSAAYRGLSQVLIDQSRTDEALRVWESFRASDLRSFAKQPAALSAGGSKDLVDAQRELGTSVTLVYMLTDEGLAIWTVSSQRVDFHYEVLGTLALTRSAERLTSLCSDPDSDIGEIRMEARKLYETLLAPVERTLSSGTVIIEPDEPLASVPFEVLLGGDGHYFVESKSVTYLPSLFLSNACGQGTGLMTRRWSWESRPFPKVMATCFSRCQTRRRKPVRLAVN